MDLDRRGSGTVDLGTHRTQVIRQVGQLRLSGRVPDRGGSDGEHRGQQDVLRRPHRRELEVDVRTMQTVGCSGTEHAMAEIEFGSHGLQAVEVQIDGPRSEVVAAGKRHPGLAGPGQQGAEDEDGGSHLSHQVERGLGERRLRDGDLESGSLAMTAGADVAEHRTHDLDVEVARHVAEPVDAGGEQGRHHVLQGRVLGAEDGNLAGQRRSTDHPQRFDGFGHGMRIGTSAVWGGCFRGHRLNRHR